MINRLMRDLFTEKRKHALTINIHGVAMRFHCDQKPLLMKISRYLKYFVTPKPARTALPENTAHCSISILSDDKYRDLKKNYKTQKIFEVFPAVSATFGVIGDFCSYEIKSSCLIVLDRHSNGCACILRCPPNRKVLQIDLVIHILLIEWLRGSGLFFIHSSGICWGNEAFLFIGHSGSGKTTASLMGIKKGLSFMGDDLLIIKKTDEKITVHSFIEDVNFCLDMSEKFNELQKLKSNRKTKRIKFDVRKYFDVRIVESASVRRLYFLNKGNSLKRLAPRGAFPLIMKNNFFYSKEDASLRHFEILCRLIATTECYMVGRSYINRHFDKLIVQN